MPQIEIQIRLPTEKGIWRWYEHLDDGENLAELLRRVVKYDVRSGSSVKNSQTLWLHAYELVRAFEPQCSAVFTNIVCRHPTIWQVLHRAHLLVGSTGRQTGGTL